MSGDILSYMKNAREVPIYKKVSKTEAVNYRPLSILVFNITSKDVERAMYDQLEKYMWDEWLLYEFQSGFQPSFSTDTCLIHIKERFKLQRYQVIMILPIKKQNGCC